MTTIIPYFDPILGKLRNSDVALISLATLVVTDPLIVNNLQVLSTASINQLHTNAIYNVSTISTNAIGVNTVQWNSLTSYAPIEGQMAWASKSGTVELGLAGGNVALEVGLQTMLPRRVRNSTGSTIPKGTAVYLNGVSGNTPLISRAIATGDQTSAFTIGMTAESIANNNTGWVTSFGALQGLNLSSFTSGDTLYLSGATAGYYTNVPTKAPIHYVRLGTVTKATTDGELIVNVINGYELDELHNVAITSLASGQILQSGASSLWYNRSLASAVADFISIPSIPSIPSLGSLAVMNQLSFTSLTNQPSLGSLAFQSTIDYTSAQLTNKPSLGSLAVLNSLTATDVGLGNVTNDAQLKIASNLSDLNNVATARGNLSLGSMAVANTVNGFLPSTASFNLLYTNGISNNSTVSTNLLYANGILASNISTGILTALGGQFASTVSTNRLNTNQIFASTASIGNLRTNNLAVSSLASINILTVTNVNTNSINNLYYGGENGGDEKNPWYGDGSDGTIYFSGSDTYSFATLSGSEYTLTRDIYGIDILVFSSVTVKTNGFRIFCNNVLTIDTGGYIINNGGNATGTTAGTGAAGNYFSAGGVGATGLLAASAGANGTAPAVLSANTTVGGVGGRGAAGRAGTQTFEGLSITNAALTVPTAANGGTKLVSSIGAWSQRFLTSGTAANFQFVPSVGGGAGAKSIIGTTATSGGGGGGGGVVFIAARQINATDAGAIQAKGGNGGNAAGTGGNFGGGGGGGGGVIGVVTNPNTGNGNTLTTYDVSGGLGGTSVAGTNSVFPVAIDNGTATSTTALFTTLTPTRVPVLGTLYMLAVHIQGTAGNIPDVATISGGGLSWISLPAIYFNTIATPTRSLQLFYGFTQQSTTWDNQVNIIENQPITLTYTAAPVNVRIILDEIQNTNAFYDFDPTYLSATNTSNSATTLSTDLGSAVTTGDLVYTVSARSVVNAATAGAGNTLLNNQSAALPVLSSEVSSAQQINAMSYAAATAIAMYSVWIVQPSTIENGTEGWRGKVIVFNG